ncbi:hypothetical protein N8T08_005082 [Aspergillus melleus]|uniref:Uncharacterized protein n=1 Tax=Aspergillus melleus TaxID=138277 RepID=A0ACC3BFG3_9EURO|nr:hypothetical protein N8T08_005082 [Aspergillus melleus]
MPNLVVINNADTVTPTTKEGAGVFSDLAGSPEGSKHPIVAGMWQLADIDGPTPAYEAEYDEVKYLVGGELTLKDETTGLVSELRAGSLLWIPKGSVMSLVRSKGVRTIYVEQQFRKVDSS